MYDLFVHFHLELLEPKRPIHKGSFKVQSSIGIHCCNKLACSLVKWFWPGDGATHMDKLAMNLIIGKMTQVHKKRTNKEKVFTCKRETPWQPGSTVQGWRCYKSLRSKWWSSSTAEELSFCKNRHFQTAKRWGATHLKRACVSVLRNSDQGKEKNWWINLEKLSNQSRWVCTDTNTAKSMNTRAHKSVLWIIDKEASGGR